MSGLPPLLVILILAVVFTAVLAFSQAVYWTLAARRERRAQELSRRLGSLGDDRATSLFRETEKDDSAQTFGRIGTRLHHLIVQADAGYTVSTLVTRIVILFLIGAIAGFIFFGCAGALVGLILAGVPYVLLSAAADRRSAKMTEQLPDALDLMSRSLRAGLGLSDALRLCAEEIPLPLAAEFGRVFEEVRFGRDYREALHNLLDRNPDLFDLRIFVSSVLLQRETGGNLIEILDKIADTIRGRFLFQAKVRALTSEARFSGLILGALPIGVGLLILWQSPFYLAPLIEDPIGIFMCLYFVCSYAIAIILMRDVARVEV